MCSYISESSASDIYDNSTTHSDTASQPTISLVLQESELMDPHNSLGREASFVILKLQERKEKYQQFK